MNQQQPLVDLARQYHGNLPERIRRYLNERGIPDYLIDLHLLGWNGSRITIPIFDRGGKCVFFKLAKDPEDQSDAPKMLTTPGAKAELYGWAELRARPEKVIICEGEFDRLVLEAQGFAAVTSTAGAATFREEWVRDFEEIPEVCICFDRDEAGQRGSLRVGRMIPHARLVALPEEVGEGGDVTDFFVRLGHSPGDFSMLLDDAAPVPPLAARHAGRSSAKTGSSPLRERVDELKARVPIAEVVGRSISLQTSGEVLVGLCPFHEDHRPSFAVYPETGRFYCFSCGKRGDVINFLRERERLSFGEALERLEALASHHDTGPSEAA
jgi:hypothetical protein